MSNNCVKLNDCIISVGSNIAPEIHIQKMLVILQRETIVTGVSKWIKTAPIGITDQNDFVNGAIRIRTPLSQKGFKNYLRNLENKLGRDRTLPRFGPRVIDLDIVIWNDEIIDDDYFTRDFIKTTVDALRPQANLSGKSC